MNNTSKLLKVLEHVTDYSDDDAQDCEIPNTKENLPESTESTTIPLSKSADQALSLQKQMDKMEFQRFP